MSLKLRLKKKTSSTPPSSEHVEPHPSPIPPAPVVSPFFTDKPIIGPPPDGFIEFNEQELPPLDPPLYSALESILSQLEMNDTLQVFTHPPDINLLPDYSLVVFHPLDFSSMRIKLSTSQYRTLAHFKHDLALIYRNCRRYVSPSTVYYEHAVSLATLSDRFLGIALSNIGFNDFGLSITQASDPASIPSLPKTRPLSEPRVRTPARATKPPTQARTPKKIVEKEEKVVASPFPELDLLRNNPREVVFDDLCEEIITKLEVKDELVMFIQPVNQVEVPSYYRIIKKPMDLRTIREKLRRNEYYNLEEIQGDFQLMINNALKFNGPNSVFAKAAKKLQDYGNYLFLIESERSKLRQVSEVELKERAQLAEPLSMSDWVVSLIEELIKIDKSGLFIEPVPLDVFPDYLQVIRLPMDLSTMRKKGINNEYYSIAEVRSDLLIIYLNAVTYNEMNIEICKIAADFFHKSLDLWALLSRHRVIIPPVHRKRLASSVDDKQTPVKKIKKVVEPVVVTPSVSTRQMIEAQKSGQISRDSREFEGPISVAAAPPPVTPLALPPTPVPTKTVKKPEKASKYVSLRKQFKHLRKLPTPEVPPPAPPTRPLVQPPAVLCKLTGHDALAFFTRQIQRFHCDEGSIFAGPGAFLFDLSRDVDVAAQNLDQYSVDLCLSYGKGSLPKVQGQSNLIDFLAGKLPPPLQVPQFSLVEHKLPTIRDYAPEISKILTQSKEGFLVLDKFTECPASKKTRSKAISTLLLNSVINEGDSSYLLEVKNLLVDELLQG
ncbi:hypothetical protein RCL1_001558 [Eukaryota sp. TZLM3-RCL]